MNRKHLLFVFVLGAAFGMASFSSSAAAVDVAVVGGGTSGIAAALAASATGAKTVILERSDSLGGTMTRASVSWPGLFHAWGRQIIAGPAWELVKAACLKSKQKLPDFTCDPGQQHWKHQVRFTDKVYEALAREELSRAGVEVRFGCEVSKAERTADGWRLGWSGGSVEAREVVDCTGNATVAALCGAERAKGKVCQPGTYAYAITPGCDIRKIDEAAIGVAWKKAIAAGTVLSTDCISGSPYYDLDGRSYNHIPGADNSTAELQAETNRRGRESMERMLAFFHAQPGLEKARVVWSSKETGVRETYRVVGRATVTEDDYVSGRVFPDAVCYSFYPIDIHTEEGVTPKALKKGCVPTVPFGSLLPKGVDNVLVAGRAISSDRGANSALRVQATCMAAGQAAGVAAALAAKRGIAPGSLPIEDIRTALRAIGAIVPQAQ